MTTFKYQGKIITTPNLEKKLKRMKISLEDIEIIDTPIIKSPSFKEGWEFEGIKEWRYFKNPNNTITHCCLQNIGENKSKYDLLGHHFTKEYIDVLEETKSIYE